MTHFVVTGFSKRGATAWLTAAVDDRVVAVAPGVFDVLNWAPSLENHRASYGFISDALRDYQEFDLIDRLRTPEGRDLLQIVDPFSYRDRLTMPKYILNASGDEFFPPDSSLFYFDALQGETLLRYLPNASHEFDNDAATLESALQGLLAWYQRIIFNVPRPHIEWRLEPDGTLRVTTDVAPLQAVLWQAQNPTARDFRFNEVGGIWLPMVPDVVNREFVAHIAPPVSGWTGAFIELAYGGPPPLLPQLYSTQVFITPTRTPFALDQPINNPRGAFFWSLEVAAALGGGARWYKPAFDAETLQSFLPVRVFNQYISTLEEARTALGFKGNIKHRALRQCLAVRLNIEAEKIDWYSPVRFSHHKKKTFLWKRWNKAHRMFLRGRPGKAAFSCAVLNYQ
ncbi:MAG: PhoPQ-activated pathogenicity-related family protein [Gammaproteobacteria bacterium]|nr:PhoPQ-activated pathogenicity-related family protein [Gammaproteobacteria bacterium]